MKILRRKKRPASFQPPDEHLYSPYPLTNKKIDVKMKTEKNNFVIDETGGLIQVLKIDKKKVTEQKKALVTEIGFYLLTPLLAGVFLGLLADRAFSTKPTLTLFGLFLGVFATFYNLLKFLKDGQ